MATTHSLRYNGAAFNADGELLNEDTKVTSGSGRAACACGALSDKKATGAARRAWFKAHKEQAAEALLEELGAMIEHEAIDPVTVGTDEDPVALGEEPAAPAEADEEPAEEDLIGAGDATAALVFTAAKPGFWASLGRDAAESLVATCFPEVTVQHNNGARTLHLGGSEVLVAEAVEAVENMWLEAVAACVQWKLTDEGFLGRSAEPLARRREGYKLTEAFYRSFGPWYAGNVLGDSLI